MSIIDRLGKDYRNLPDILFEYENELKEDVIKVRLPIKGKNLEEANAEHAGWQYYYEARKADLRVLVKYFEARTSAARGKLFKSFTESYNRELSDRQKDKYIDNDPKYLAQYEVYLQIKEVYDRYEAICNAFLSRGYALNNITKIRVASLEDVII